MLRRSSLNLPICVLLSLCLASCVSAQEIEVAAEHLTIPDGTPIKVQLVQSVSSAHAKVGDPLDFVVVQDVNVAGFTVIPGGTIAHGSVTGVQHKRLLGVGGNLSLKIDSLTMSDGERVELRASEKVKGGSRTKLMVGAMIVTSLIFLPATPVFLLTRGHDSTVVKSTEITARIEGPVSVPLAGLAHARESSGQVGEMMSHLPPRVFSGEGREGDMVNLVFVANEKDLQLAFERGGWVKTDKWTPKFVWHLAEHGTKDLALPMARFYLFGRVQDYSYALPDPNAVMSRRHHLRIWRTDYTVNGTPIWAGAATHDVAIEIAKHGRLINHRIDPAVDVERDFVGSNLAEATSISRRQYLYVDDPVLQAQTASGEPYHSDGKILMLDLHPLTIGDTGMPRQSSAMTRTISLSTGPDPGLRLSKDSHPAVAR